jgi:hypothetical protein
MPKKRRRFDVRGLAAVALLGMSAAVAGQEGRPAGQAVQSTESHVTVTGCLQRGSAPVGGKSQSFVLTQRAASGETIHPAGNVGTDPVSSGRASPEGKNPSAPRGATTDVKQYHLVAVGSNVRFDTYVGQLVEVRGRVSAPPAAAPGSNDGVSSSTPSGSTGVETIPAPADVKEGQSTPAARQPREQIAASILAVTSLRTIAETCAGAAR